MQNIDSFVERPDVQPYALGEGTWWTTEYTRQNFPELMRDINALPLRSAGRCDERGFYDPSPSELAQMISDAVRYDIETERERSRWYESFDEPFPYLRPSGLTMFLLAAE